MGGFYQLRVKQRLLFKRYSFRGMKQWCVDAETIADGPADQAFEGLAIIGVCVFIKNVSTHWFR